MSHRTAATVARTIGIDTGKNTLHLIGLDDKGANRFAGEDFTRSDYSLANVPRCLIGIEAGMATHYVARELSVLGHCRAGQTTSPSSPQTMEIACAGFGVATSKPTAAEQSTSPNVALAA
jgi:hypothetical protein